MSTSEKLAHICPYKLHESYEILFDLQNQLGINDEYLLSIFREAEQDTNKESLQTLLKAWESTRDNLITWYLKQTLVELNVTISLLTAKMKFVEYKLGACNGLDVHQACSLSLVNFCNILADMTILNTKPSERKTMHMISKEVDLPAWLNHYRNQICHVPSESPCIAILMPLVIKALEYMRDSFWSKILENDSFDIERCRVLINTIATNTSVTSINQSLTFKKDLKLGKKRMRAAKLSLDQSAKAIKSLRRLCKKNPAQVTDMIANYVVIHSPNDSSKNFALLLEQVILARSLERLIFRVLETVGERTNDKKALLWLSRLIEVICATDKENLKRALNNLSLNISVKMINLTFVPSLKCCQIAYKMTKIDNEVVRKLITRMRYRLKPMLGAKRTRLFIELTKIAKGPIDRDI